MCNKCENFHSQMMSDHISYKLNEKLNNNIFTGICTIENHKNELLYFCKSHNELCCASCITKIKGNGNGQHTDCEIVNISDISNEKKNKLKVNLKCLEELSNKIEASVNELKKLFKMIEDNKESLKISIQKIFTKIKNSVDERENELLKEVEKKYEEVYFNEKFVKLGEKLPKRIKESLEKGSLIDKEWDKNKLNFLINNCIIIENNISDIKKINENIEKCKIIESEIKFTPDENELDQFIISPKINEIIIYRKLIKIKNMSISIDK